MRGILFIFFFIFLNAQTIKVCINPDWAPIEFKQNGIPQGISIDILKKISQKTGFKLEFINTDSWLQSQQFLKEGKCDITPTAVKTKKREKYAIFTQPYLSYDLAIITTIQKPYVTDLNAIIDKTFTRKKGSGIITKLKNKYPNIKIIQTPTYAKMFYLVSKNKVYATIATLPVFSYYKKRYNLNNLKVAGFSGWKYNLRIMVNKNKIQLRDILNKELSLLSAKDTQEIYEKWIVKTKPEFDYKKFIITILTILFILVLLIIWIYILHKKNEELHRLSNAKSEFLSNMSHELRTPLNALIGFINVIKNNPDECKKYIPLIESSANAILSEIDDILNFDRLNKNVEVKNKIFSTKEFENIILFYQLEANKKNISLVLESNLPKYLFADIDKIRNVLVHLLDNAVKFTKEGKIVVTLEYKNQKLFVSIKDTGIGIKKDKLEEIFKEFIQLDKRVNKEYKGIGIGLSISKKLINALGGELKVKSEIAKGSEFYFEIPVKKANKIEKSINLKDKILLVEDNKANQMFMKVILKQLNIDFDIAENGKEAVEKYKKFKYPIILMDINMPIMDGITATSEIRKFEEENNLPATKIIAVTANAIDGDEDKFLACGMDGYISKPVDINKLKHFLKQE